MTTTEDAELLKYAGGMGHQFVGIAGRSGERRVACETNTLEAACRLSNDPYLIVYSTAQVKRKRWLNCYDRPAKQLAESVRATNLSGLTRSSEK